MTQTQGSSSPDASTSDGPLGLVMAIVPTTFILILALILALDP